LKCDSTGDGSLVGKGVHIETKVIVRQQQAGFQTRRACILSISLLGDLKTLLTNQSSPHIIPTSYAGAEVVKIFRISSLEHLFPSMSFGGVENVVDVGENLCQFEICLEDQGPIVVIR